MFVWSAQEPDYQPIPGDVDEAALLKSRSGRIWHKSFRICGTGRSKWRRLLLRSLILLLGFNFLLLVLIPILKPSYSNRPPHFTGKNINNEKVFIAANIEDEGLIRGAWGKSVLDLIDLLGQENVFLSIYENDGGPGVKAALEELSTLVKCRSHIISDHIDRTKLPTVQFLPNDKRVKRITYLAAARNYAIDPLADFHLLNSTNGPFSTPLTKFDKLLFLNDVVFSPKDAADLLFSTNIGPDGRTRYDAACAMDYINPFKFYDRFALRDNEYYESGLPWYPWFTPGGSRAESWRDVMLQKDAVRVKSCWGGMAAFEARWFTESVRSVETAATALSPLRFRSEEEVFWDASECCLIHADLQDLVRRATGSAGKIFVNPYVRVAYDEATFKWLEFSRRFERLGFLPHLILGWLLRQPKSSARAAEVPGHKVAHAEWIYSDPPNLKPGETFGVEDMSKFGTWKRVEKTATPGGYCGGPMLLALRNPAPKKGERYWEKINPAIPYVDFE
ncbi:hypothetical protein AA313_de0208125 [Arthrobotrys entomopaga]|nr:hypothetical protein AA313_de0208125 [Arthrobotrys entomopaga]